MFCPDQHNRDYSFITSMKYSPICALFLLFLGFSILQGEEPVADEKDMPRIPATPLDKVLDTFEIRPGLEIKLAAHEPNVEDPIAMSFDEDGRMFVIEMRGYSEHREDASGRIRMLTDTNGDGVFDKSTIYVDGLKWPTALICYKGGIFVGATPDITYHKDTDGDGVADEKKTLFTGFGKGKEMRLNMQALFNGFRWGPDNRIWGSTAGNGGTITKPGDSNFKELPLRGADFSFDPELLDLRAENGTAQYGISFDSEGRRFLCSNSNHAIWVAYERGSYRSNPWFAMSRSLVSFASDGSAAPVFRISPDEPWRIVRTRWRVSKSVRGVVEGGGRVSGYFTAATGINIYWGDALGDEFRDNLFVGDAGSNLFHRKLINQKAGESRLIAERPADEKETEFLRSTDNWFRPVSSSNAPDGCLYLCDMHRETIEHPWSIPEGIKRFVDLDSGNNRGRIYRIQPKGHKLRKVPQLSGASDAELQKLLTHSNDWHQTTARRLLYERGKAAVAKPAPDAFVKWLSSEKPLLSKIVGAKGDSWKEEAILNSLRNKEALSEAWNNFRSKGSGTFEMKLVEMIGRSKDDALGRKVLASLSAAPLSSKTTNLMSSLKNGTTYGKSSWGGLRNSDEFAGLMQKARQVVTDKGASQGSRIIAANLLGNDSSAEKILQEIVSNSDTDAGLRSAAVKSIKDSGFLIGAYPSFSDSAKAILASRFVSRSADALLFLKAIEAKKIALNTVPTDVIQQLRDNPDKKVKNLAASTLPKIETRAEVVAHYQKALKLKGDAKRGAETFGKICITCHRTPDGKGSELGPDIQTYKEAGPESILVNILDPNREVAPQYQAYTFEMHSGEFLVGLIASENATEVNLRMPGGLERKFSRKSVKGMKGMGGSLMPVGLEATLKEQDIADLISFIKGK